MASIAKRADGRWRARYRDAAGNEHARHFARRVDAQSWLDSVTTAVGTGSYVDPSRAKVTVGTMAKQWFAAKIDLRTTTRPLQKRAEGPWVAAWGDVRDVGCWSSRRR